MIETQQETRLRLRQEGREELFCARYDELCDELKKPGVSKARRESEAWNRTVAEFPPLPAEGEEPVGDGDAGSAAPWGNWEAVSGETLLPESWGKLASSASLQSEAEWVHQNRFLVVEHQPEKRKTIFHWDRAQVPPPSYGAMNLMEFAATNFKGFMDLLHRVSSVACQEVEIQRFEKMRIAEVRRILEEVKEEARAEAEREAAADEAEIVESQEPDVGN